MMLLRYAAIIVFALTAACSADDDRADAGRIVDAGEPPDAGDASISDASHITDASSDASAADAADANEDASEDAGGGAVPEPVACGGADDAACADGFTCFYALFFDCQSPLAEGTCSPTPAQCEASAPVCGCDDVTYESPCAASAARVSIRHDGACESDEPDCILDMNLCDVVPQRCEEGFARTEEGDCHGPCVPIATCRCGGPGLHCPQPDHYACDVEEGLCAPIETTASTE